MPESFVVPNAPQIAVRWDALQLELTGGNLQALNVRRRLLGTDIQVRAGAQNRVISNRIDPVVGVAMFSQQGTREEVVNVQGRVLANYRSIQTKIALLPITCVFGVAVSTSDE